MTREEQLFYCKKCTNRDFNITEGILCQLTGEKADFENNCASYELDKTKLIELAPSKELKPNIKRATIAQNLIWTVMIMDLISIISSYMQYDILQLLKDDMYVFDGELENNDTREVVVGLLYSVIYIISAITFIQWFRRAYYNLSSRVKTRFDEGWAAGSWFVPILNLFRPYQIMSELYERTAYLIKQRSLNEIKDNSTMIIGIWWAIWLISNYLGKYAFRTAFKAGTIEDLINSTTADITMSVVNIPLGLLAIWLIKNHSKNENLLLQLDLEDSKKQDT